jgi:DNA-binding GntR family transcriptional regulator
MTQHVPPAHIRLLRHHREGYNKNIGPVKKVALPEHLAEKLNLSPSESALYRVQISGELVEGNEKPLQISYRYYLLPLSDEKIHRMQNDSTYDPLWNENDVPTDLISHDEVTPRLATEGERDFLDLPESTPVTNVFEAIRDKDNTLLMVQEIVLSPRTTLIFDFPFTNRP